MTLCRFSVIFLTMSSLNDEAGDGVEIRLGQASCELEEGIPVIESLWVFPPHWKAMASGPGSPAAGLRLFAYDRL